MKCPKCRKEEMKKEIFEGLEIDRCPTCKGIFLDKGELTKLIKAEQASGVDSLKFSHTSDMMDDVPAICPRCNKEMTRTKAPGDVVVDLCEGCAAIFLDQGELATIQLNIHQL